MVFLLVFGTPMTALGWLLSRIRSKSAGAPPVSGK
jgi:hypothetical protein